MPHTARLLIYGRDAKLTETRRWVLEKAGFQVLTALELPQIRQTLQSDGADLLILCHTLSHADRQEVLATTQELRPEMKRLILAADTFSPGREARDQVLSAFSDPKALIEAVGKMTSTPALTSMA